MKFKKGEAIKVLLDDKLTVEFDPKEHDATFVCEHADGEWADVDLQEPHTKGEQAEVRRLSVPMNTIKQIDPKPRTGPTRGVGALGALLLLLGSLLGVAPARAQFIGYTTPQTVEQSLATNVACTGSAQTFTVNNLGQTQHAVILQIVSGTPQTLKLFLEGSKNNINFSRISDELDNINGSTLIGSGYYTAVRANITCSAGSNFSLFYNGTSVTPAAPAGDQQLTLTEKVLGRNIPAGSNFTGTVRTPYGNMLGSLLVVYSGAGPANSTISVTCTFVAGTSGVVYSFPVDTTSGSFQVFPLQPYGCTSANVTYTAGGASASTLTVEYLFAPPGVQPIASAVVIAGFTANGALAVVTPGNWNATSSPVVGTTATATRAAAAAGVRHVANCVSATLVCVSCGGGNGQTVVLRDGATGVGTILWQERLAVSGADGTTTPVNFCGLNLVGSPATAMTLEFSGATAAAVQNSVSLTGYDSGP